MATKAGYEDKEEKDRLFLNILRRGLENKPEGNVRAYLFQIFNNVTGEFTAAAKVDPERSMWEARAKSYNFGSNNWIFKSKCPPPDDPDFRHHCPAKYLHLFGVT